MPHFKNHKAYWVVKQGNESHEMSQVDLQSKRKEEEKPKMELVQ